MKKYLIFLLACLFFLPIDAQKKREFRGAWIQCVNGQFQGIGTEKMQQTLSYQLDELKKDGVNAIIFQVRAECDALYASRLEPWSRFLTGRQGMPPSPYWDPLQWMVEQCHKRGMELHAWINPYRAKTKNTNELAVNHVAITNPSRCFDYDGLKILNPGLPENRNYICMVVSDIVRRYDIDGIHMDDYFYPYPVTGQVIPDDTQYQRYNNGIRNRADWRRYNVNMFVKQLYQTVHQIKPWVKVGISPFGIYRNRRSDPAIGSNTNGLQNYDDLYADVLLWVKNGWLDYCAPQIYWEIGNKAADYETLIRWWNHYASKRPLYIGEDIERTVKAKDSYNPNQHQQIAKFKLHHEMKNVDGTILWYAKAAVDNPGNYGTLLRQYYWNRPSLQPDMSFIEKKAPRKVRNLRTTRLNGIDLLTWVAPRHSTWKNQATKYVVYRFNRGEKINLENPSKIYTITTSTYCVLPSYKDGKSKYTYVVTALNRIDNEGKPVKKKVK